MCITIKNKYIFQTNTSQNKLFKQLNEETIYHSIRVAEIATELAKHTTLNQEMVYDCGIWHDAGKTKILDIISNQKGLSENDWYEIRKHPIYGDEIIENLYEGKYKENVKEVALLHHCRINNGGYPLELRQQHLPLLIEIVSIADCFEAMTAKRVYKEKINPIIAKEMIMAGKCGDFSKEIIEIFEKAFPKIEIIAKTEVNKNYIS